MHRYKYSYSASQFLDESSNLKARCKENAFCDALDAIYMSCIHNSNSNFVYIFSSLSCDDMHHSKGSFDRSLVLLILLVI